jgi:hypothetical protein
MLILLKNIVFNFQHFVSLSGLVTLRDDSEFQIEIFFFPRSKALLLRSYFKKT